MWLHLLPIWPALKLNAFIKDFPESFIQCGIAEANMIGIAAGLTIGGKIPYTTTFANFSTGGCMTRSGNPLPIPVKM